MRTLLFIVCLLSLISNVDISAQCDSPLPGEIYLLETFETENSIFKYLEDAPGAGTFSFDTDLGPLSTIVDWTFAMDVNPVTGTWYIAASPDGDDQNRHLFTYDPNTGILSASLGQLLSSAGSSKLQAMTFDGNGNLWGSFALGMGVSTVEMVSLTTLTGTASSITFGNGNGDGLGATGMTWDFDSNKILISGWDNNDDISLFAIDPSTQVISSLFQNLDVGNCSEGSTDFSLQGMDYCGNNQLISTMTFGCDDFVLFDIASQAITVLGRPFANDGIGAGSFKDLVYIQGCQGPIVPIPTLGEWGLLSLSLLLLIFGVIAIKQRTHIFNPN